MTIRVLLARSGLILFSVVSLAIMGFNTWNWRQFTLDSEHQIAEANERIPFLEGRHQQALEDQNYEEAQQLALELEQVRDDRMDDVQERSFYAGRFRSRLITNTLVALCLGVPLILAGWRRINAWATKHQ